MPDLRRRLEKLEAAQPARQKQAAVMPEPGDSYSEIRRLQ